MSIVDFTNKQLWKQLESVPDPEIPVVGIVEMGIVRYVSITNGSVEVTMTPTFSGCPALHVIRDSIENAIRDLGIESVEVKTVLSPPWSTDWITEEAKQKLKEYGITPPVAAPKHNGENLIQLDVSPMICPRCDSINTETKNTFGPTLCKSIHYCNNCNEPFESFKAI